MSGTILTPGALWRNFKISSTPAVKAGESKKVGNVTYTQVVIDGRKIKDQTVKIHGVFAAGKVGETAPAILLVRDFESGVDERIQEDLAKKGYIVLAVDIAGQAEGKEFCTDYPESISYANYENAKAKLYNIEGEVKNSCWYEWTAVLKYALALLRSRTEISSIGGFGIGEAATVMWQLAGTENLDCVCFALNAGWNGYRGIYKFSKAVEPQFSDNMYKFIAGIEPQAYSMHVKCPVLMLSATNSRLYDCDRAYDTVNRTDSEEYRAVHYSVGYRDRVSGEAYNDACMFFDRFLKSDSEKFLLPKETDIKCEIVDGKLQIEVCPDAEELKELAVYISEETVEPCLRAWKKYTDYKKFEDGKYVFSYSPYHKSGLVTMFAETTYKSGFSIGSNIIAKRFEENEVASTHKENILYSSTIPGMYSLFTAENQAIDNPNHVNIQEKRRVHVKKGPMGIEGIYCEWGLMSFKMNASKDKPNTDAILMFDVYSKEPTVCTVKLIADYFGAHTEYLTTVNLNGGELWRNVKITRNKFKTAEGMPLKNYDKINAVSFNVEEGEYLINNALWV